eukprot:CAMPEP_0196819532 /NCGR_PEP_ID=MMETSP1362-20130617/70987_1 /TAXON_ID=163516 /ORGANISM="Leptocylindrus danicus, Strain CCMP1856" /LENGTH=512 /DNA_ID=CAMNT_0042198063 /DNA_START=38 /DNA_END=1576 /DNA_ORIENTATION=+
MTTRTSRRKIVFIHLDLGIGGAEQLIINLATASLEKNTAVEIYTAHCDQTHCFDEVRRASSGILAECVNLRGTFLPDELRVPIARKSLGGKALCSSIRMIYLTICAVLEHCLITKNHRHRGDTDTVFVLDVLPTSMPIISFFKYMLHLSGVIVLFYCHFPDKLLTRDTVNGEIASGTTMQGPKRGGGVVSLRKMYRWVLDQAEEYTMTFADLVLVNSHFTRMEVQRSFPYFYSKICNSACSSRGGKNVNDNDEQEDLLSVLYPAINLDKFVPPAKSGSNNMGPIVSLNRFERKKNIELLLHAISHLKTKLVKAQTFQKISVIIAGGYDHRNAENVEYLQELKDLAEELDVASVITFATSISDEYRATLLQEALCVCYTPHREHFGIVPLEAMYAGSPVIAVKSGGPMETVVHQVTGMLVEGTSLAFAEALYELVSDPARAKKMGMQGHGHVKSKFGLDVFRQRWRGLIDRAIGVSRGNTKKYGDVRYASMPLLMLLLAFVVYYIAQYISPRL